MKTEMTDEAVERRSTYLQFYWCIIANLSILSPGMNLAYAAVTLPVFKNKNETFNVNDDEASWIASLSSISTPVGSLIVGPLLDRFGRKYALLSLNIPCVIGWLFITFSNGTYILYQIYVGRLLTGLACGMVSAPCAVFMSEIAKDAHRGMLVTWTSIAISLGLVLSYALGAAFPQDWRLIAAISAGFPVVASIISFVLLPESPPWLVLKGRIQEAEQNYRKIRGLNKDEDIPVCLQAEYDKLLNKNQPKIDEKHGWTDILKAFTEPTAYKPLFIMNTFFLFQQFSGTYIVLSYAVDVVLLFGVTFNPYYVAILLGVSRLGITFLFGYISMRYGRRLPVITSGIGMSVFTAVLTLYLYLQHLGVVTKGEFGLIPVVFLILLVCTGTLGFLTLPWAMIGEIYPVKIRGLACGLTTCFANILNFASVKTYPGLVKTFNPFNVFLSFTIIIILGTIFVTFFLPETQGKTLAEIEDYFRCDQSKTGRNSGIFFISSGFKSEPFFHPDDVKVNSVSNSDSKYIQSTDT